MQGMKPFNCDEMLSVLKGANSILLCTHVAPDGDAIGSTLAMGLALKKLGKQVFFSCADPIPARFHFLPGAKEFVQADALAERQFDAALAIDAAELARIGDCAGAFEKAPVTLQIDHHGTNPSYAMINYVDGDAAASGCLILRCMDALGIPLAPEIAQCIYCGISTDTGNFCFDNTDEETFICAARLMEAGLPLNETARKMHLLREEPHVRLLGRALNTLKIFADGKCAWMCLTREDFLMAQAGPEHTENIVNYARDLPGIEMAFLGTEQENGSTKFSLRAQPPRDVAAVAKKFQGGGHKLASGCRIDLPLLAACAAVEKEMLLQIEENQ